MMDRSDGKRHGGDSSNTYATQPKSGEKFPSGKIRGLIKEVLNEKLSDKTYQADHTSSWTKEIADECKQRIKALNLPRYKIMVQAIVGELRGQGVRFGTRCFWDSSTDDSASETFSNESLYAAVVAYGVYLY